MFFDRLLKLQSLKFRLLGGTSFAQLYSAERLPLHKFRKEGAMLSPLIAGLLAACGGGGGGVIPVGGTSTRPTPEQGGGGENNNVTLPSFPGQTIFDATGSQIQGAKFYIDTDGDGKLSAQERANGPLGTSNAEGQIAVDNDELLEKFGTANELSIIADLEGARNLDTGEVFGAGDQFRTTITKDAVGSMQVLSSLTTLLELLTETGLSEEQALEKLFGDETEITADDLDKPELYDPLPSALSGEAAPAQGSTLDKPAQISKVAEVAAKLIDALGAEEAAEALAEEKVVINSRADDVGNVITVPSTVTVENEDGTDGTDAFRAKITGVGNEAAEDFARKQATQDGVPVAFDDAEAIDEQNAAGVNTTKAGNVLDNDEDEIGDTELTVTALRTKGEAATDGTAATQSGTVFTLTGDYGTLTLNEDGSYSYAVTDDTLKEGQTVTEIFTYTVSDGDGESDTATLTFTITGKNHLPVITDISGDRDSTAAERYVLVDGEIRLPDGTTTAGVITATDVEDDAASKPLTYTIDQNSGDGAKFEVYEDTANNGAQTIRLKDGETPKAAGETYVITVRVEDDDGGVASKTITIIQSGVYLDTGNGVHAFSNHKDNDGQGVLPEDFTASKPLAGFRVYLDTSDEMTKISTDPEEDLSAHKVLATVNAAGNGFTETDGDTYAEIVKIDGVPSLRSKANVDVEVDTEVTVPRVGGTAFLPGNSGNLWLAQSINNPTSWILIARTGESPTTSSYHNFIYIGAYSRPGIRDPFTFEPALPEGIDLNGHAVSTSKDVTLPTTKTVKTTQVSEAFALTSGELGTLGVEGVAAGDVKFTLSGTDADKFAIIDGKLYYIGEDGGDNGEPLDYEADPRPDFDLTIAYEIIGRHSFTESGYTAVQRDGDAGNADTAIFNYEGMAVSNVQVTDAGTEAAQRTVDIAAGSIFFADSRHRFEFDATTLDIGMDAGRVIIDFSGVKPSLKWLPFGEDLPAEAYVLAEVAGELLDGQTLPPVQNNGESGHDDMPETQATGQLSFTAIADGPSALFGGVGDDKLVGGGNRDVLYGDAGRDVLTGNAGSDIFVVQPLTDAEIGAAIAQTRGSITLKHYNLITDFELKEDKLGIVDFDKIKALLKTNDNDWGAAVSAYLADVATRAEAQSISEIMVIFDDLGFTFRHVRTQGDVFEDDLTNYRTRFLSLIDTRGTKNGRDDVSLFMFGSEPFSSDNGNPFLDTELEPLEVFEFL